MNPVGTPVFPARPAAARTTPAHTAWRRLAPGAALAAVACLVAPTSPRAEVIDRIVARVDEQIVTQTDIVRMLPIYAEVFGVGGAAFASTEACNTLVSDVVDFMVTGRLLEARAQERSMAVSPTELSDYVADQYRRMRMSEEQFIAELALSGIDYEDFRAFMALNLNRTRMMQAEVAARVAITDADVERVVQERYPDGLVTHMLTTSHLFVQLTSTDPSAEAAARAGIEARAARLAAGEAFEAIAADNEDGTRRTGGSIGRFASTELDQAYVRAALGLEVGEVSAPIRSGFGYHVIRLDALSREPVADGDRLRDVIRFELQNAESEKQQELFLERLVNDAYVVRTTADLGYCDGIAAP